MIPPPPAADPADPKDPTDPEDPADPEGEEEGALGSTSMGSTSLGSTSLGSTSGTDCTDGQHQPIDDTKSPRQAAAGSGAEAVEVD